MPDRLSLEEGGSLRRLFELWGPEALRRELDRLLRIWDCEALRAVILIRWNPRLRTTVGRALLESMIVELNPRLLARYPKELPSILAHEAAHLVVRRLHGSGPRPHGRIWKSYMRRVGESTRATHCLDTRGLRSRRRKRSGRRRRVSLHW